MYNEISLAWFQSFWTAGMRKLKSAVRSSGTWELCVLGGRMLVQCIMLQLSFDFSCYFDVSSERIGFFMLIFILLVESFNLSSRLKRLNTFHRNVEWMSKGKKATTTKKVSSWPALFPLDLSGNELKLNGNKFAPSSSALELSSHHRAELSPNSVQSMGRIEW